MPAGSVFNIQKYSVHDGPGIRTVVFLKGCPLRCKWCSNPESWDLATTISLNKSVCVGCKNCFSVCSEQVVTWDEAGPSFNFDRCTCCGKCEDICVGGGIKIFGRSMEVDEIIREVLKDRKFYLRSGGGMTISGGEPLLQHDFTKQLLLKAREYGINTNVETTAFASQQVLADTLSLSDLIFCDLKHVNNDLHKQFTGVDNSLILENIQYMSQNCYPLVVRIPLIPRFNNDRKSLEEITEFVGRLKGIQRLGLLPYHNYGKGKYDLLGRSYDYNVEKLTDDEINDAVEILQRSGHPLEIGD